MDNYTAKPISNSLIIINIQHKHKKFINTKLIDIIGKDDWYKVSRISYVII